MVPRDLDPPPSSVPDLLEAAAIGGLELERGVLDVEVAREAAAEFVEHGRWIGTGLERHVGRHDVHARRDRPGVQVVDVADTLRLEDVRSHFLQLDPFRGRLQQDVDRFAQEAPRPGQDEWTRAAEPCVWGVGMAPTLRRSAGACGHRNGTGRAWEDPR